MSGTRTTPRFVAWRSGRHLQAEAGRVAVWVGLTFDRLMVGLVFNTDSLTFGVGIGPLYFGIGAEYDR